MRFTAAASSRTTSRRTTAKGCSSSWARQFQASASLSSTLRTRSTTARAAGSNHMTRTRPATPSASTRRTATTTRLRRSAERTCGCAVASSIGPRRTFVTAARASSGYRRRRRVASRTSGGLKQSVSSVDTGAWSVSLRSSVASPCASVSALTARSGRSSNARKTVSAWPTSRRASSDGGSPTRTTSAYLGRRSSGPPRTILASCASTARGRYAKGTRTTPR